MSTAPRVSVIMIFLDAGRYIDEAIASVLAQSVEDWELVLVDDGSSDASREIALSHAARDPARVRLYEHPGRANLGTGPSRNLGMRMARGRYVAFLDADDVYEPRRLERCASLLDADPGLGVVISRDLYWRRWAGRGSSGFVLPDEVIGPAAPYGRKIAPPRLIAATLATCGAPMPAICGITFRRAAVDELGGVPEEFTSQYEDQALIVKLLLACSALVVEECLTRYRQHAGSLTHRARHSGEYRPGRPHEARRAFLAWIRGYARRIGVDEPLVQRAIDAELALPAPVSRGAQGGGHVRRLRPALLQAAAVLLPQHALDALIRRWWAWKRARVARRAATIVAALDRGRAP